MQLAPKQLERWLDKPVDAAPVRIIWLEGKEPLLIARARDALFAWLKPQFPYRHLVQIDASFHWQSLLQESMSLSLFEDHKIYDLRFTKATINQDDLSALSQLISQLDSTRFVLISSDKIDKKMQQRKAFKSVLESIALVTYWPLPWRDYPHWIRNYISASALQLDQEAIQFLASQHEGNLLALAQTLDRLVLIHQSGQPPLSVEQLQTQVLFQGRYTPFDVVDLCLDGQSQQAILALKQLLESGGEPILINWALTQAIETLQTAKVQPQINWAQHRVFGPSVQRYQQAARRLNDNQLRQALTLATLTDNAIKGVLIVEKRHILQLLVLSISKPDNKLSVLIAGLVASSGWSDL